MINRRQRHKAQTSMEIEYKRLQGIIKTLRARQKANPEKEEYYNQQLTKYLKQVEDLALDYDRTNNTAIENRARAKAQVDGYREIVGRMPSDPPPSLIIRSTKE